MLVLARAGFVFVINFVFQMRMLFVYLLLFVRTSTIDCLERLVSEMTCCVEWDVKHY